MGKIHLFTDSTADIDPEFIANSGINVVPLSVNFGDESFLDGVEITKEVFFEKLQTVDKLPTTSQVSVGAFVKSFNAENIQAGDSIISLHISQKLSGTYQACVLASKDIEGVKIYPIDSKTTSIGLGFLLRIAKNTLEQGASAEETVAKVQEAIEKQAIYFSVGTLEYLQKGGRIGKAQALVGGLLNIKPLLHLDQEGAVAPFDKIRGKKKVLKRLEDLLSEYLAEHGKDCYCGLIYGINKSEVMELKQNLAEKFGLDNIIVSQLGPVIGTHVGPQVIGIAMTPRV